MTKKYIPSPGLLHDVDDLDLSTASWAEPGDSVYFYDPKVISETDDDITLEIQWGKRGGGPSVTYDRSVSETMGPGRRVGHEPVCVDCIFSAACIGGSPMSFQLALEGWLDDRVFARLGHDSNNTLHGSLADAVAWEPVPYTCPGAPRNTDRVVQRARVGDTPPEIVLIAKKNGKA